MAEDSHVGVDGADGGAAEGIGDVRYWDPELMVRSKECLFLVLKSKIRRMTLQSAMQAVMLEAKFRYLRPDAQGSPESVFSCFFLSELFICAEGGPGFFLSVKRLLQNVLPDLANHELETWDGNALSNISVH